MQGTSTTSQTNKDFEIQSRKLLTRDPLTYNKKSPAPQFLKMNLPPKFENP